LHREKQKIKKEMKTVSGSRISGSDGTIFQAELNRLSGSRTMGKRMCSSINCGKNEGDVLIEPFQRLLLPQKGSSIFPGISVVKMTHFSLQTSAATVQLDLCIRE
jgi:hypothetical protein